MLAFDQNNSNIQVMFESCLISSRPSVAVIGPDIESGGRISPRSLPHGFIVRTGAMRSQSHGGWSSSKSSGVSCENLVSKQSCGNPPTRFNPSARFGCRGVLVTCPRTVSIEYWTSKVRSVSAPVQRSFKGYFATKAISLTAHVSRRRRYDAGT